MRLFVYLFVFSALFACSSTKYSIGNQKMEEYASARFGSKYATKTNKDGRFVIVFKKLKDLRELMASVHYFVYDKKKQIVITGDTLKAGTVKWYSDYEIMAVAHDIRTKEGERIPKQVYIYHVLDRKKRWID